MTSEDLTDDMRSVLPRSRSTRSISQADGDDIQGGTRKAAVVSVDGAIQYGDDHT